MVYSNRSVLVNKFGGYDCLEVGKHTLAPLDGLIEVSVVYCGLNFADIYSRQGLISRELPFVLGMECVGVVKAVGCESEFNIGDNVICYDYNGGMFAEIIRIDPNKCYRIPDEISLETAASVFVSYMTAYFSLQSGNLRKNESLLIQSCGGGVGWAATQLAKLIPDVTIYGTASEAKKDAVLLNGIDHFVTNDEYESISILCPQGLDLILDSQSGKNKTFFENLLNPLGRTVLLGISSVIKDESTLSYEAVSSETIPPLDLIVKNRTVSGIHLGLLAEQVRPKVKKALNEIFDLITKGQLKPKIDSVWKFEEIVEACRVLGDRKNIGKVLLKL